jgi:hypothetical protein
LREAPAPKSFGRTGEISDVHLTVWLMYDKRLVYLAEPKITPASLIAESFYRSLDTFSAEGLCELLHDEMQSRILVAFVRSF